MILLEAFYNTVEFYVIAAVIAAAILGACVRPSGRGAVVTHLLAGDLFAAPGSEPSINIECLDNGSAILVRQGVECVGMDGAVSLAIEVSGFDITIRERLVPGNNGQNQTIGAMFTLTFMGRERYHIRYESDDTGYFTAFTLMNSPGVKIHRPLRT